MSFEEENVLLQSLFIQLTDYLLQDGCECVTDIWLTDRDKATKICPSRRKTCFYSLSTQATDYLLENGCDRVAEIWLADRG